MLRSILGASLLLALAGVAQADVIAPIADLTDAAPQLGNFVSGIDNFQSPSTWRVYSFQANAGDNIVVRVTRQTAMVDPIAYAHRGALAGADIPVGMYYADDLTDFGLTFLAYGDDSVDDPFGGPFGDPLFGFSAPENDTYTVITHMYGNYEGNPGYEIQVSGSTVPAPGAAVLACVGGMLCLRRRRSR
jgi:hypothetical protein